MADSNIYRRRKSGSNRDQYFINKLLVYCPWEFKKEDGVWYKRPKRSKQPWEEVIYAKSERRVG